MIEDEKIIELFFERSEQGIRELDMKYGKICHNLSYNIVNSRRDAEECVNDAYLGAWNAIPPVHPNPLLSYIVKIVRNISLKTYWRKEAAKRSGHYTVALEEIEGYIADQKTVEDEIEAMVAAEHDSSKNPSGSSVGRVINEEAMDKLYIDHIISTAPTKLNGLKVVMDCSNGANSLIAPVILRTLGAHVITIFNQPNGININNGCGSTHLEALQAKVLEEGADVGIANDGDADRCLCVDEKGNVITGDHILYIDRCLAVDENGKPLDGDQIMLICALELMKKKELHDNVLVTTVMSNVGLHKAMAEHGGRCVKTNVGDRYVLEEMLKEGYNLGGEQSGHIIFSKFAKTGDGILTAVQLLSAMVKNNKRLSELGALMTKYPQILLNVRVKNKYGWEENEAIKAVIKKYQDELGDNGQVLVRASGTEPLIRIMAEGPVQERLEKIADSIGEVVTRELG